jgi:hypothetical protein
MLSSRYSYDRANAPSPEVKEGVRESTHTKRHRPCVVEDSDNSDSGEGKFGEGDIDSVPSSGLVVLKYRQREPKSPLVPKPAASRSAIGSWLRV